MNHPIRRLLAALLTSSLLLPNLYFEVLAQEEAAPTNCFSEELDSSISRLSLGNVSSFNYLISCGSYAVPKLITAIQHEDKTIRLASIAILGENAADASKAIPELVRVLTEGSQEEQMVVASALGKIGEPVIPDLINVLTDENAEGRWYAALALGDTGESSVPDLINTLSDSNVESRVVLKL